MKIESARIMGNDLILTASIPDARRFVYGFKPGEYEISPAKKKRSLNANAYAWKLINDIALAIRESPEDVYREALKNIPNICEVLKGIPENSIHYEIFSPPFASLYTYSNSERDLGNCRTTTEFYEQFKYIVSELYRVLMPGRLVSFHCMDLPLSKERDGIIGIRDFRGEMIRLFEDAGFVLHSQVCIWKDPVTAMQRTKALGLLHKQIKKDSCMSRQGIPDYLVTMRKPGENPERVTHTNESFPVDVWQRYASPVWMDINPSDTLQASSAKEDKDERHICPLQLGVIRRGINLWTNPGDTVLTPFLGIGSEAVVALQQGRKAIGIELKSSYYKQAVRNCEGTQAYEQISLL